VLDSSKPLIMPQESTVQADYDALNELVVNCPELAEMESLMGGFNLFSVLGFEYGELRHSNALAWLFDPIESHGLGDSFLQSWLMTVLHEANTDHQITPVDVDCWNLLSVEVRREWKNIDLLFILEMADNSQWVICIENKVNSRQHSNQLTCYRETVEQTFPKAAQKLYLFLTKDDEEPEDDAYLSATYTQIHQCLTGCAQANAHAIGNEPRVLIDNYLRLLAEKFMNESDIARLAQKIYKQHKKALDVIYEQRPDNLLDVTNRLVDLLQGKAQENQLVPLSSQKARIRFIPESWNQSGNSHGQAVKGVKQSLVCEIWLSAEGRAVFEVASWPIDEQWSQQMWEIARDAPFVHSRKGKAKLKHNWLSIHMITIKENIDWDDYMDPDEVAEQILGALFDVIKLPDTQKIFDIIADKLPTLDAICIASTED
jgi:hypothetical protein